MGNSSCVLVLEPYSSQTSPEIYSTLPCRLMNKSTHYSTLAMSYSQLLYSLFVNSYLLYSHVLCHVQTWLVCYISCYTQVHRRVFHHHSHCVGHIFYYRFSQDSLSFICTLTSVRNISMRIYISMLLRLSFLLHLFWFRFPFLTTEYSLCTNSFWWRFGDCID